jgi:hypothetical protein
LILKYIYLFIIVGGLQWKKMLQDVVIVAAGRSAVGKGYKGSLKNTHPVDLGRLGIKGCFR